MIRENVTKLKEKIIGQAKVVQSMIEKSIEGLLEGYSNKLFEVIKLEKTVNKTELEIDALCTNTIALYQPEAKDLRTVLMIYRINNDIERIGDQAVNIAESSQYLIERAGLKFSTLIPEMAQETITMIDDSITAFINEDIDLAKRVCERDNIVDNYNEKIIKELIRKMGEDSNTIERAMHLIRISKNLERVADLSTNIAEDTIFMSVGQVIKHNS